MAPTTRAMWARMLMQELARPDDATRTAAVKQIPPRSRGRPRKRSPKKPFIGPKRPRGRPRKTSPKPVPDQDVKKRPRGRPRIHSIPPKPKQNDDDEDWAPTTVLYSKLHKKQPTLSKPKRKDDDEDWVPTTLEGYNPPKLSKKQPILPKPKRHDEDCKDSTAKSAAWPDTPGLLILRRSARIAVRKANQASASAVDKVCGTSTKPIILPPPPPAASPILEIETEANLGEEKVALKSFLKKTARKRKRTNWSRTRRRKNPFADKKTGGSPILEIETEVNLGGEEVALKSIVKKPTRKRKRTNWSGTRRRKNPFADKKTGGPPKKRERKPRSPTLCELLPTIYPNTRRHRKLIRLRADELEAANPEPEFEVLETAESNPLPEFEVLETAEFNPEPEFEVLETAEFNPEPEFEVLETAESNPEPEFEVLETAEFNPEPEFEVLETAESNPQPEFEVLETAESNPQPEFEVLETAESNPQPEFEVLETEESNPQPEFEVLETAESSESCSISLQIPSRFSPSHISQPKPPAVLEQNQISSPAMSPRPPTPSPSESSDSSSGEPTTPPFKSPSQLSQMSLFSNISDLSGLTDISMSSDFISSIIQDLTTTAIPDPSLAWLYL